MPLDLPITSSARRGQLVGDGHLGDLHDAAQGIGLAAQIDDAGDPGHADGDVGEALAPRSPERVGHDDPDRRRRGGPARRRGAGGPSGRESIGRSAASPRCTLERSTPLLAHTKPWRVSVMTRSPRRRSDPHRFVLDDALVRQRIVGVDGHEAALGLRDDLLGHDEDVAVGERDRWVGHRTPPRRCRPVESPGRISPMPSIPQISSTAHRPTTFRARPAATPGSLMMVSVTTQRTPWASTSGASAASSAVDDERAGDVAVQRATPATLASWPSSAEHPVGGALDGAAADDRRHGDDRRRAAPTRRSRTPGRARSGPDRHDRVRRRDDDHVGAVDGVEHARRRAGRLDAGEADAGDRPRCAGGPRSTPGSRSRPRRRRPSCAPGRRSSGRAWTPRPQAAAISAVTVDSGAPSASRWVRYMCVARSWSPRENHVPPAPDPSGRTAP